MGRGSVIVEHMDDIVLENVVAGNVRDDDGGLRVQCKLSLKQSVSLGIKDRNRSGRHLIIERVLGVKRNPHWLSLDDLC